MYPLQLPPFAFLWAPRLSPCSMRSRLPPLVSGKQSAFLSPSNLSAAIPAPENATATTAPQNTSRLLLPQNSFRPHSALPPFRKTFSSVIPGTFMSPRQNSFLRLLHDPCLMLTGYNTIGKQGSIPARPPPTQTQNIQSGSAA
ncbi:hypothetical protein L211DRAFT_231943 [Terfezia boudieri ATCC MYA-4762]|uniref:Uncharacterized protein n=1 Tax=Terfezia boudieri ATCC MYA-4762 TaxID=1051890 RepID=A0A3N4LKX4_9PEZI|nr:hypothetical protein L211DRAFT_231943 [Terfezia boudieri ATCC MYA-4762]